MDRVSPEERSRMMSRIRGTDTQPEIKVRSFLHRSRLRFRLHCRDLPGSPDIVLPRLKCVVFVHGCFWHQHAGCAKARLPKSNHAFWNQKLHRNVQRDEEAQQMLEGAGWTVHFIWGCEIDNDHLANLVARITGTIGNDRVKMDQCSAG